MLSVIVPAFNEEENIQPMAKRVGQVLDGAQIPYELVFVDDGSSDATFPNILAVSTEEPRVRGISFSRNFGKEAAIFAGLAAARGDCCAVMDGDLQHPPETLVEMYACWQNGCEIVEGVKEKRADEPGANGFFAKLFYRIICKLTGFDMSASSDYKLLDRKVVDILLQLPERSTFFRGLTYWAGFRMAKVSYQVAPRLHGKSKWSFSGLVKYAVANITNFSSAPLSLITGTGIVMCGVGVILMIQTLVRYLNHTAVEGFTTVILLQLLTVGLVLMALGIIGHYIAKIYDEVKARPRYIVQKTTKEPETKPTQTDTNQ